MNMKQLPFYTVDELAISLVQFTYNHSAQIFLQLWNIKKNKKKMNNIQFSLMPSIIVEIEGSIYSGEYLKNSKV